MNALLPSSYAISISDGDHNERQRVALVPPAHPRNQQYAQALTSSDGQQRRKESGKQYEIYSFQNPTSNRNSAHEGQGSQNDQWAPNGRGVSVQQNDGI